MSITIDDVREAHQRVRPHVVRTPLLQRTLPSGLELYFKPESLQPIGAFKLRGAFSLMTTLPADCPGVIAHSSGNHAQAVARAARVLGLKAVVVMPSDAPTLKRARTEADGAEVVTVGPDSDERIAKAEALAAERGLVPVPPYDHPLIMAGQGTAALEVIEDAPHPLDRFYCPVSGGGLLAGCGTVFEALSPATEVVGVEPATANDTALSLAAGERVKIPAPDTLADGLRVRTPGAGTWPITQRTVRRGALVSEDAMLDAMAWALGELRLVLEPSGAVSLAAALAEADRGGRVGVLLSGGNVEPALLARVAARAR
ncbi:MAG: threonine/serine dehydratase [Myxococcales bacterium]|nr:threonine/serine dehydratase [Myxococcales bacterium]